MSDHSGNSASPLTTASALRCPHGGTVQVSAGGSGSVRVGGAPVVSAGDAFTVTGCRHTDGGRLRPCTTVRFTAGAGSGVLADGRPVLTNLSSGQCLADDLTPHGPPVAGAVPQGVSCR